MPTFRERGAKAICMEERRKYKVKVCGNEAVSGALFERDVIVTINNKFEWCEASFRKKILNQLRQFGWWFSKIELKYIEWYDGD